MVSGINNTVSCLLGDVKCRVWWSIWEYMFVCFLNKTILKPKSLKKRRGEKKKVNFIPCDYVVNSCFAFIT